MKHIIFYIFTIYIQLWIVRSAKFPGTTIESAHILLKHCHQKAAFGLPDVGHARDHVKGLIGKYSLKANKTGFENNDIQDQVLQKMIGLDVTKLAITALNNAIPSYKDKNPIDIPFELKKQTVSCSSNQLGYKSNDAPTVLRYVNGKEVKTGKIRRMKGVKLVLAHENGKQNNENADVFVYTLYPY